MPQPSTSPDRDRSSRSGALRREDTVAGFWFLTTVVAALGPVLFAIMLTVDKLSGPAGLLGFLVISPDSAQTILGSIAGSLITIASLTASLTIVTLQLLSSQYTPRAVRGFLRRKISQVVSGAFIAIFVYCLLMLVAVRQEGEENSPFVPSLGVAVAIVLAVAGLGLLVMFIDALARTIQVSTMTGEIATDTLRSLRTVHPDGPVAAQVEADDTARAATAAWLADGWVATPVGAVATGYVRRTDRTVLGSGLHPPYAAELLARAGDFVTRGEEVVRWWAPAALTEDESHAAARAVLVGVERDLDQDPAFGIRQLVDIALRALSPGINDPTTAVTCLGYLRGIYESAVVRPLPVVRIAPGGAAGASHAVHGFDVEAYLQPLAEIAGYAASDARVSIVLLEALVAVRRAAHRDGWHDRCRLVRAFAVQIGVARDDLGTTDRQREQVATALTSLECDAAAD